MGAANVENVIELEVLTYDGLRMTVGATGDDDFERSSRRRTARAIYRAMLELRERYADRYAALPPIPRRVSGYNLPALLPEDGFILPRALVGSEARAWSS